EPVRQMRDRADDDVGNDSRALEVVRPKLPGSDEDRADDEALGPAYVRVDVVTDDPRAVGIGIDRLKRGLEVGAARLAEDRRLDVRGVLETRDERTGVEKPPARGLPPTALVEAEEIGPRLQLRERTCEVHVAEDAARLLGLVGAAEQHSVRTLPHELDS